MDLRALRHFVTLVRNGSYIGASRELNITQPALSRSIAALEDELGSRLVERHRTGCVATPAGELLLHDAAAILHRAATLKHNMKAHARGELGHLRFGAAPLPAVLALPSLLSAIAREETGLTLGVAHGPVEQLAEQLRRDQIEFFLCAEARLPKDKLLAAEFLFEVPLGWLVRKDHPLAQQVGVNLADLLQYPLANVMADFGSPEIGAPHTIYDMPVAIACDDYSILLDTIRQCDAVCLASTALLPENPDLAALDIREDWPAAPSIRVVLASRRGRELSPQAQSVRQRLFDLDVGNECPHPATLRESAR